MKEPENTPNHVKTIAMTIIVLVVMTMLFAGYFLKRYADAPGDFIDSAPEFIKEILGTSADGLAALAEAVNTQTIKLDYTSTATTLAGTARLQVATISQVELFERHDSSILWGVPLPDVVVSARAPIEYTYYIDLTGALDFYLVDDRRLYAIVPLFEFNKPAVDASAIEYTVQKGSVIRNHDAAIEALKQTITEESYKRARENMQIARELARRQVEWFVQRFIGRTYGVDTDFWVTVVFRDETMPDVVREVSGQVENLPSE